MKRSRSLPDMPDIEKNKIAPKPVSAQDGKAQGPPLASLAPGGMVAGARKIPPTAPPPSQSLMQSYDEGQTYPIKPHYDDFDSLSLTQPLFYGQDDTRSVSSDGSAEFSANVTASTRSFLAKSDNAKFIPCEAHPCTPRIHRKYHKVPKERGSRSVIGSTQNLNTRQQTYAKNHVPPADLLSENYNNDQLRNQGAMYWSDGSFGYEHRRRGAPLVDQQHMASRSLDGGRTGGIRKKVDPKNCPGPTKPYKNTASRVITHPLLPWNYQGDRSRSRSRSRGRRLAPVPHPFPQGEIKKPSKPKKRGYTDIRMKQCDIIKKPELGESETQYLRKDGKLEPDWKKSIDKLEKEKKKEEEKEGKKGSQAKESRLTVDDGGSKSEGGSRSSRGSSMSGSEYYEGAEGEETSRFSEEGGSEMEDGRKSVSLIEAR